MREDGMQMIQKEKLMLLVGENVKREREKAGLTQECLAEHINLDAKTLSKIERGKVGISLMTLYQICQTLCISSSVILSEPSSHSHIDGLMEQLEQLSPEQYALVNDTIKNMLRAFEMGCKDLSK